MTEFAARLAYKFPSLLAIVIQLAIAIPLAIDCYGYNLANWLMMVMKSHTSTDSCLLYSLL